MLYKNVHAVATMLDTPWGERQVCWNIVSSISSENQFQQTFWLVVAAAAAQNQDPEAEATKWNSVIIHFYILLMSFSATCENVSCEKGL